MKTIPLTQGKVALVDDADYELVSKYVWHVNMCGRVHLRHYAISGRRKSKLILHRFLLGITDPKVLVDHKDGNGLNCQRDNLRIATSSQNNANRTKGHHKNKYLGVSLYTTRYKGITYSYFKAQCKKDGKIHAKTAKTEDEAARLYNEMALALHGEFASLNTIG